MYTLRPITAASEAHAFYEAHREAGELTLLSVNEACIRFWMEGDERVAIGAYDSNRLVGMALGAIGTARSAGFLSYLCVTPTYRRRRIGTMLCDALESALMAHPTVGRLEIVFHSPIRLPWYIPDAGGDYHPCMPGVSTASELYPFLCVRGWSDFARQNGYYRRLSDYTDAPHMATARDRLADDGIELTLYDPARHYGLPELFDNIRNPGWKAQVLAHLDRPVVVAVDHHRTDDEGRALVVSYTGPLSVDGQPGRGNFCGIGTRTDYRGRGIGKQVFCAMCRAHRDAGADFMSLYTGTDNPARNIYESAGFVAVRQFADMRK